MNGRGWLWHVLGRGRDGLGEGRRGVGMDCDMIGKGRRVELWHGFEIHNYKI